MSAGDRALSDLDTNGELMDGLIDAINCTDDSQGQAFGLELVALIRKYIPDSAPLTGYKTAVAALVTEGVAFLVGYVSKTPTTDQKEGN